MPPEATLGELSNRLDAASADGTAIDRRALLHTQAQHRQRADEQAGALLARPLDAAGARRLALLTSPALQALLAEAWQRDGALAQAGQPLRPRLAIERLVESGGVSEWGATLSAGLTELVLWPQRQRAAEHATAANRLQLAQAVLGRLHRVQQQWTRSVAAAELAAYHAQVADAADTGAELARRMEAAGHFSRLQRAREEALASDANSRLARARLAALAEREALLRLLGLDEAQAALLKLPERLPPLPAKADLPRQPADSASPTAADAQVPPGRLDLAIARQLLQSAQAEPDARLAAADAELAASFVRHAEPGGHASTRGLALHLGLPLDGGRLLQQTQQARLLAAQARLSAAERDARSQSRQQLAARHTAWQLAHQARQTLVPLRQTIADETLLRYNGMLGSVFELLAAAREQVGAVISALEAQRDFWLADAAWQATVDGLPPDDAAPAGPPGAAPVEATAAH